MTSSPPDARRIDLDWIRIGAFALLILYHVGMFYVTWDYHVKSPHASHAVEPFMFLTNPWRLTLLFIVSGAATAFMAAKMTPGAFTWSRLGRLVPPLLLGMFVIVPPQTYYEILEKAPQLAEGYASFWVKYATASGNWCDPVSGDCLVTPTWNHLWFVAYLIVYSLIIGGLLSVARKPMDRAGALLEKVLSGWGVLVWPIVWLALLRLTLMPLFEITHNLTEDWYNHALSFSAFLQGFLMARREAFWAALSAKRWPALVLWALTYGAWTTYAVLYQADDAIPPEPLRNVMRVVHEVNAWTAMAAIFGFARLWLTRDGPARRYLTDAIFPLYIMHQTIIVVAGHHLAKLDLPLEIEGPILIAITFAGCFATYEIVRRIGFLRPWFGLKSLRRHPEAGAMRDPVPDVA